MPIASWLRRSRSRACSASSCISPSSPTGAPTARPCCCAGDTAFTGDIRATGDVLIDQLVQMQRSAASIQRVLAPGVDTERGAAPVRSLRAFYQGDAVPSATSFCATPRGACMSESTASQLASRRRGARQASAIELHAKPSEGFDAKLRETVVTCCEAAATWPRDASQQLGRRGHGDHPPDQRTSCRSPGLRAGNRRAAPETLALLAQLKSAAGRAPARAAHCLPAPCRSRWCSLSPAKARTRCTRASRCAKPAAAFARWSLWAAPWLAKSVADRAAPRAVGRARRSAHGRPRRAGRKKGLLKFNPLANWSWGDVWHYIATAPGRLQPAARPVFPQHRLRALHPRHQPG
jgi:phosphoadenosine phosphosulfate reductase